MYKTQIVCHVIDSFCALEFCVKTLAGVKIIPFSDKSLVVFKSSEYSNSFKANPNVDYRAIFLLVLVDVLALRPYNY